MTTKPPLFTEGTFNFNPSCMVCKVDKCAEHKWKLQTSKDIYIRHICGDCRKMPYGISSHDRKFLLNVIVVKIDN